MAEKPKILIIEDNYISRNFLKKVLETENYYVIDAENGTKALDSATKQSFDLIIQDLILPDMDGFELNKKIRMLPGKEKIPIFAISGFLNQFDKEEKSASGFTQFLLKPIEASYLLDLIKVHLPLATTFNMLIGKGKHILIADDNPIQLKLFSMQLRNLGFEVTTALDGIIALQEAKIRKPDAIISDILMPNLDGYGLCIEIKRDPKLSDIPVMLLTSHYVEDEDLALANKVGASSYLTRIPDIDKLVNSLMEILNAKPLISNAVPFEVSVDVEKKHTIRTIRQLEQQVLENAKLGQRAAMLMSQLSLISAIVNALTSSSKNVYESLREVLYFCLDSTGISKGVLYLKKSQEKFIVNQQIGYRDDEINIIESFFGLDNLIQDILVKKEPFAITQDNISIQNGNQFLASAQVKSALLVPLYSGEENLGVLFLGSDSINFLNEDTQEFIRTLGMQVGQSIALATSFEKLTSSEKRYRQLVEISPDAIFIQQNERFVYANNSALRMLGIKTIDELQSRSFYDYFPSDSLKIIQKHIHDNVNIVSESLPDLKLITLNGTQLDVEIVISSFIYQEKPAVYMIMRDITERKRSALHLEIQYRIAWVLAESDTLFVATAKMLQIICESLAWDCGLIWAVDKDENVLRCTRVWQNQNLKNDSFEIESLKQTFTPGTGLPGTAWKEKKAIWQPALLTDPNYIRKGSAAELGWATGVAFPIIHKNDVFGIIEFYSINIKYPDEHLLLWFESIGNQFGVFVMRKHLEKQMLYLAEHDVLTGLSNRSLLEQYLLSAIKTADEKHHKVAILFLDLDHFKYVNDSLGHHAGDDLLKEIADRFRRCLRPQDTVSRLGGDEFVIILSKINNTNEVNEIIDRIQNQLSRKVDLKNKEFFITASIGVSLYPDNGDSVQNLIKSADIAMYSAKEKGRNTYQFCTKEMTEIAENRGNLQSNLAKALDKNEFILYYQPKIDVATQKISGMEALIRWKSADTILLPFSFIAAAEGSDLIISIGEWVLKTAFMQNKVWQSAGLPNITMSVNLSVRNLNKELLLFVENILRETNLAPGSFEVELTESSLMINVENNINILKSLKDMGLKISVDDFGTGYSSLSYLKRFPIDTLKIDKSFVSNIAFDPDDAAIVTAIIAMAHSLGFRVIAEGVETEAQLKFLCQHGCDEIQGFYFSRPLPLNEATAFIRDSKLSWHFD